MGNNTLFAQAASQGKSYYSVSKRILRMSKYEPRAKTLKEDAAKKGWKLAWTFRRGRFLYLTITKTGIGNGNDWDRSSIHKRISSWSYPTLLDDMSSWVHAYYPRVKHLTSFSGSRGTWLILDVWEEMKNG